MSKIKPACTLGLLVAGCLHFSSLQAAVLTGVNPTIINVGTGADTSYLVIDESTLYSTPLEFIYNYTYDSNNLITAYEMLQGVTNIPSSGLSMGTTHFSFGNSLDSFTYAGTTVAGTDFSQSDGFYWSSYLLGGLDAGVAPTNTMQWNYANSGIDSRTIAPGSWDGWTLSGFGTNSAIGGPPSVNPSAVPEPASLPLVLLSLAGIAVIIRWKSSKAKSQN